MDFYEVLEVAKTASPDEIKASYRRLAMIHHPDKNLDKKEESEKKIKAINEAYDTLKDPDKKSQYDDMLKYGIGTGGPRSSGTGYYGRRYPNLDEDMINNIFTHVHHGDINDMFKTFFHQANQQQRQPINKDCHIALNINLKEAFTGADKVIQYKEGIEIKTVSVKIPKGVRSGTNLRLAGKAPKQFSNAPAADIIVHLAVNDSEGDFRIVNDNLVSMLEVDILDTITGCKKKFTNIDGEEIEVDVPKSIRHTEFIRIQGKGMTFMNSDLRGTLVLQVFTNMPENLSETVLTKIQKINEGINKHRK